MSGKAKTCSMTGFRFRYLSAVDAPGPAFIAWSSEESSVCTSVTAGSGAAANVEPAAEERRSAHGTIGDLDLMDASFDGWACCGSVRQLHLQPARGLPLGPGQAHQRRLKHQRRGESPYQGDHQELAHAGRSGVLRG